MARVVFCAWSKEAAAGSNLRRWRHQYPFKILQNSWETTHVSGWKVDIMCLGHKWGPSRDSGGRQMSSPIQNLTRNPKEPWNFARPLVHHGLIASKKPGGPSMTVDAPISRVLRLKSENQHVSWWWLCLCQIIKVWTPNPTHKVYSLLYHAQVSTPRARLLHDIHKVEQEALVAHAESAGQYTDVYRHSEFRCYLHG